MFTQNFIEWHLLNISPLSIILYPFSLFWGIFQRLRRIFWRFYPKKRAAVKIISIGNITAGGSGKTPFTIWLAEYLRQQGRRIAISHRGYKGYFEYDNKIISDREGILTEAESAGDEALLLAEKLSGIPVCVGKDRWKSIELLTGKFPDLELVILDDSFQHLKVQHDLDIVIFKTHKPIGNGFLIPAGILREPLSALKDADLIILNGKGEIPEFLKKCKTEIRQGNYRVTGIYLNNQKLIETSELSQYKLGIISGIANPNSLENTIRELNLSWQFHRKFPDHYHYNDKSDQEKIEKQISASEVNYIITTEKDYTKLKHLKLSIPVAVIRIEFYLLSGDLPIISFL